MGLSDKKEQELKTMPKLEFHASKSKDGRFVIHKTTITDIKPVSYYEKVLSEQKEVDSESA